MLASDPKTLNISGLSGRLIKQKTLLAARHALQYEVPLDVFYETMLRTNRTVFSSLRNTYIVRYFVIRRTSKAHPRPTVFGTEAPEGASCKLPNADETPTAKGQGEDEGHCDAHPISLRLKPVPFVLYEKPIILVYKSASWPDSAACT